eukprot:gnl/MRDRNA2_/MRDRNA2_81966_c0_seq1.p1 gnl/MRDRNA2_/MRDRNA2_81966_c0~~gnl/MRDRNA2_/MRDRNA2_81966_c0_seq1.p1  ORF type:complete len:219 (-),score=53.41 gnl/MRDRNA2_/MRDRNA2_81966_c0_seq1:80-736(-)
MGDDEATKLWRVRKTVFEMLNDRGWVVGDNYLKESREELEANLNAARAEGAGRERFVIIVNKKGEQQQGSDYNPKEHRLIVFFPEENKRVGVKPIRILAEKMDERKIKEAILVVRQPLTPLAHSAINEAMVKMRIEVFHENELIINITRHELVAEHIPLNEKEKQALLDRYQMKPTQLPRIQVVDPVARYFGLRRDEVVKIIRPSETAGRYVTYRLVV